MRFISILSYALLLSPVLGGEAEPAAAPEPVANAIEGRLVVASREVDAAPDLREAVVFLRPAELVEVEALPEPATMRMVDKAFSPGVLAVTAGSTVTFPNLDPILHNAFSTSSSNRFDLGFYGAGKNREVVFTDPGLVRVFCNVHHGMAGYVMVLDTPFHTRPDADGSFRLELPEGTRGTLYAWHPQARVERRNVDGTEAGFIEFSLVINGRRVPRHLNKHGKPYRRSIRKGY